APTRCVSHGQPWSWTPAPSAAAAIVPSIAATAQGVVARFKSRVPLYSGASGRPYVSVTSRTKRPVPRPQVSTRQWTSSVQIAVNRPHRKWYRKYAFALSWYPPLSFDTQPRAKLASRPMALAVARTVKMRIMRRQGWFVGYRGSGDRARRANREHYSRCAGGRAGLFPPVSAGRKPATPDLV